MNWFVFVAIIILAIVTSVLEYHHSKKDSEAVTIFLFATCLSILGGYLFAPNQIKDLEPDLNDTEYLQYYTEMRERIYNAERNRNYDLVLDILNQLADKTEIVYGENSLELGSLYAEIAEVHNFLSNSIEAEEYIGLSKKIVLNYIPNEENYIDVAQIYKACGDAEKDITEIEYFYNMALDILEDFNDTSGDLTANICANFSDAYCQVNNHVKALQYAERARQLYEKTLGTTSREAGIMYCSLGNIYANRNHIKALEYYQQAEAIFKNNAPDDDSFLATCYSGMANLYSNVDQEKCYKYAFAALNINKAIFGECHEHTIRSEVSMAVFYRTNGNKEEAKLLLEEALAKADETYGNSFILATIYIELGNLEDSLQHALSYYDKAEAILKSLYGEEYLELAYVYANKSVIYYNNGDYVNAKANCNRAVNIYKNGSGSFSPELAYLYCYMGEIYYDENQYELAVEKYKAARQIYDTLYSNSNINSAKCMYKIARVYSDTGRGNLADELFKQSIEIYEMTYGEYSFQNADIYNEYAKYIYRYSENIDMAIEYSQRAVEFSLESTYVESISQMKYCFVLGNLYIEGDYTRNGINYLEECVYIAEDNGYIDNPTYIEALCALAQQYSLMDGEEDVTIQYINKAIDMAIQAGTPEDYCAAYYHTSIAWGNLGKYDQALEYLAIAEREGLKVYDENSNHINSIKLYREKILEWM